MPRPLRPGRPARGRHQHTEPRPRSLHIGSHSAPRRPASRPGHAQRPAHLQPLANACSTLAACCCCCRPAAPTPLAMAYAGLLKTRWGLASSIEITPSGHHEDCDLLAARCVLTPANPPLPRVPPPDRIYMYSLEIALRLAHIRKIHLYFSTHRSLSARCDLSRVSYIPPRACAATRVSLPTLPVDRM
jgi:hypothetical protein